MVTREMISRKDSGKGTGRKKKPAFFLGETHFFIFRNINVHIKAYYQFCGNYYT